MPQDPSTLKLNVHQCPSCGQYLPYTEYQLSAAARVTGRCKGCRKLDNEARSREDYSVYCQLLLSLRKAERNFGGDSQIVFLLQVMNMFDLIDTEKIIQTFSGVEIARY